MADRELVNGFIDSLYQLQRVLEKPAHPGLRAAKSSARAALAQLRRTVGKRPGEALEALEHVAPYLPEPGSNLSPETREREAWEKEAFFLVAGLFATHPTAHELKENLGDTFRALGDHESATKRFTALLNAGPERLAYHLRQAVQLAAARDANINYRRLLFDVLEWRQEDRRVQLRWARHYWRRATVDKTNDNDKQSGSGGAGESTE